MINLAQHNTATLFKTLLTLFLLFSLSTIAAEKNNAQPQTETTPTDQQLDQQQTSTENKQRTLEQQWADEISESFVAPELTLLQGKTKKFVALFLEEKTGAAQGGVIILHSMGTHPNWQEVISPLRKMLPKHGWSTLSIQLPVLSRNATAKDYGKLREKTTARIQPAVRFFQNKGIHNIVLIGHGLGATMAAAFLSKNTGSGINAFVAISIATYKGLDAWLYSPNSLENISLPVLDIYGNRDRINVLQTVEARSDAARKAGAKTTKNQKLNALKQSATAQSGATKKIGYIAYRQIVITGADHYFIGFEENLSKRINGWLRHHAGGVSISSSKTN